MKLLCVLSSASLSGGSTKAFLSYCSVLAKKTDVSIVVTVPNIGPAYTSLQQMGIAVEVCPIRFCIFPPPSKITALFPISLLSYTRHLILSYKSRKRLEQLCKKYHPDIIYTNVSVVDIGNSVANNMGIPHVYHIREFQTFDFGMKILPSFSAFVKKLSSSYSICITHGISQHFGQSQNPKSRVIYDGVKSCGYQCDTMEKKKYFLFVGRLNEAKGIKTVLQAFKSFSKDNNEYELLIAGEANSPQASKSLKQFCIDSDISSRVHFLGVRNDIDNLMKSAYATIMASYYEAFGLVTAEAMFNNCLVIGRNTGGTKEQFDNGLSFTGDEIGLRFLTEEDLVLRMKESVLMDKNNYHSMIIRANRTVKEYYTIEKCAASIYNFLRIIYEQNL